MKTCLCCGREIRGREDKKFCDYQCRNQFNNQAYATNNNYMRRVLLMLRRNRRILARLLQNEELIKTSKSQLESSGFRFQFLTHTQLNRQGQTCFFCFEYGYLPLDKDWYLVVRFSENDAA